MNKFDGYLCMVLHTHLPYVNHIENDNYIEEQWLYEAISETYIPLLMCFKKLIEEKVKFKLTITLTPPLLDMLDNKIQQEKYIRYLEKHIELSKREIERTKNTNKIEHELAKMYYDKYSNDLYLYNDIYKRNIILQFKELQDIGVLEIVAGLATHGFIPMLYTNEKNIDIQIKYGVATYRKYFGKEPQGIWLSECGYVPEVEKYLEKYNIKYFFTEMHGVIYAQPVPIYGIYAPITTQNGICVFGRNVASTMKIWSNRTGYPGDDNYREFNRDIGYDLDYEYIKPYITYDGVRIPTGLKYYRVSKKEEKKEYYDPGRAKEVAETHAYDYMKTTIKQIEDIKKEMNGKQPIIISMQDTELYGHWWYEGPYWLYILIKKIYYDQNKIDFITPTQYINEYPEIQVCKPNISTWGSGGSNVQWMSCTPAQIYIDLDVLSDKMCEIAEKYKNENNQLKIRALNQCARELLLLQSSDWYFNLTCHRCEEYSYKRIEMHRDRFNDICDKLENNNLTEEYVYDLECRDSIFSEINFKDYIIDNN